MDDESGYKGTYIHVIHSSSRPARRKPLVTLTYRKETCMKLAARSLYGSFFIQYQYTELTKLSCRRAPEGSHREYYAV